MNLDSDVEAPALTGPVEPGTAAASPGSLQKQSRRQTYALLALAFLLVTLLRLLTLPRDPLEWDEVLFTRTAAEPLDIRVDRPHPPGFPVFVAVVKLLHGLGLASQTAATLAGVLGGLAAIVAVFVLVRELGAGTGVAAYAATIYALIPSVWLHGVRALSDSAGAAGFMLGAATILRFGSRPDAVRAGTAALVVALAVGIRPQTAVALAPLGLWVLVSVLRRSRAEGVRVPASLRAALGVAAAVFVLVSTLVWLPVVTGSGGFEPTLARMRAHAEQVRQVDSRGAAAFLDPVILRRWLLDPFGSDLVAGLVALLALAGAVRQPARSALLALVFLPLIGSMLPVMTPFAAPRYATAFMAFPACLAALCLSSSRAERWAVAALTVVAAALATQSVPPALWLATRETPAHSLARWLSAREGPIAYSAGLQVHLEWWLPGRRLRRIQPALGDRPLPGEWVAATDDELPLDPELGRWEWPREPLARLTQGRYLRCVVSRFAGDAGGREIPRQDDSIPASVDEVREEPGGVLFVRGWCQERNGRAVFPAEFRIDRRRVEPVAVLRTPRPDVGAAIAGIGDCSQAGYEARLRLPLDAGTGRDLVVVFRTQDGRERVFGPVRFTPAER